MAKPDPTLAVERRRLRRVRESLGAVERRAAERAIAATLARLRVLRHGRRVAVYLSARGEVNLRSTIDAALRAGVALYAPRVTSIRRRTMAFARLDPGVAPDRNRFGLEQPPAGSGAIDPICLDYVLMPVVGFDRAGNRLGMGLGFYDRRLRHLARRDRRWRRPRLIGIAFDCQQLRSIDAADWDVALDMIVTESKVIVPRRGAEGAQ